MAERCTAAVAVVPSSSVTGSGGQRGVPLRSGGGQRALLPLRFVVSVDKMSTELQLGGLCGVGQ